MRKLFCMSLLLLILGASVLTVLPVHAQRQIVVPDDYSTIQRAIDAADPGDTVLVRGGQYNETLTIPKVLNLIGQNGAAIQDWAPTGKAAILVTHSGVTVSGFTIQNSLFNTMWNPVRGIHLLGADNCVVSDNHVGSCPYGEAIWLYQSNNNTIIGNTVSGSSYGIHVGLSENNTIKNNDVITCDEGATLYDDAFGNLICANKLTNCSYGLELDGANRNTICENIFSRCGFAIQAGDPYDRSHATFSNVVFHNTFEANNKIVQSFFSNIGAVYLDNGEQGNYYSDYSGVDEDGDGLGDQPYFIVTQGADLSDSYPLMAPWAGSGNLPPFITLIYPWEAANFSSADVTLNFTANKALSKIQYSLDHTQNVSITGNVTLTALPNGNHTLTLYAQDEAGRDAKPKTVNFTVTAPLQPTPPSELSPVTVPVFVAALVFLCAAISVAVYFSRRRKCRTNPPKTQFR